MGKNLILTIQTQQRPPTGPPPQGLSFVREQAVILTPTRQAPSRTTQRGGSSDDRARSDDDEAPRTSNERVMKRGGRMSTFRPLDNDPFCARDSETGWNLIPRQVIMSLFYQIEQESRTVNCAYIPHHQAEKTDKINENIVPR